MPASTIPTGRLSGTVMDSGAIRTNITLDAETLALPIREVSAVGKGNAPEKLWRKMAQAIGLPDLDAVLAEVGTHVVAQILNLTYKKQPCTVRYVAMTYHGEGVVKVGELYLHFNNLPGGGLGRAELFALLRGLDKETLSRLLICFAGITGICALPDYIVALARQSEDDGHLMRRIRQGLPRLDTRA